MEIRIDKSFEKDIKKIRQPDIRKKVAILIEKVQEIPSFQELSDTKKIKGFSRYYRIRLGDYRIGVELEDDQCIFLRVLHRKDIYKYFP